MRTWLPGPSRARRIRSRSSGDPERARPHERFELAEFDDRIGIAVLAHDEHQLAERVVQDEGDRGQGDERLEAQAEVAATAQ